MQTILVTGGAGFIGSNLVDAIPPHWRVVVFDNMMRGHESLRNLSEIKRPFELVVGDVRNPRQVNEVVAQFRPQVVYHLAALPSHRLALTKPPRDYVEVDVMGTINVLDACREYGGSVVFASSNKVYGHQPIPHEESMPKLPHGPYGQAKATSEDYCYQYSLYHGVASVAIRFHHAVGPRCHSELVLPIFGERALRGGELIANGRYEDDVWVWCSADFTHIKDITRGLLLFASDWWQQKQDAPDGEGGTTFRAFNFGTGKDITVYALAQMVVDAVGNPEARIVRGVAMPHEGLHHLAKVYKARLELNWQAQLSVADAVKEYVAWRKQYPVEW